MKLALAILLPLNAMAQIVCALGTGAASYKAAADQRPSSDALALARRVNMAVKTICMNMCPEVALFRNATAPNAMLTVRSGEARLVYAPAFFETAFHEYGDPAIIAILAHELGHALDDAMGAAWIKKEWTPELRADSWAGCTLARMGLSPPDLESAVKTLAQYPPPSQPNWTQRAAAARAGFTHCGGDGPRFDIADSAIKRNGTRRLE